MDFIKETENLNFWKNKNINITNESEKKLFEYFILIREKNKVMNLTGIDDLEGVYLKHFFDSLTIFNFLSDEKIETVADVGSGAGFPGMVLAICLPEKTFYLIEPLKKRCLFLEEVKDALNLKNVIIINDRSENINQKFDVVTSRAVANLSILLELCIPITKVNGTCIAMKGSNGKLELENSKNAISKLDSSVLKIEDLILPVEESNRTNIYFKKEKETNKKYPRNFSQIKNKPL